MPTESVQLALAAWRAAGLGHGGIYLSTPITTGLEAYRLVERLRADDFEAARKRHPDLWASVVQKPNEDSAEKAAGALRKANRGLVVVNPAAVHITGWHQPDYDHLWSSLLNTFRPQVAVMDGWQFSRGARLEIALAIAAGLPVTDQRERPMSTEELSDIAASADATINSTHLWSSYAETLPDITG
ncbi:DUF4406 domain-containing protein [Propionicimonas sp.]|uniref:DUF4406 domain-containing protein n=1 Tax=Propionicimonas sp. TaxID=1955623 RepID=UPI0018371603|nr:DUF4406 domain-containing protein [Propionicimonas sp.]MBU3977966.1 DUF4406 domain-containing protein [Actinomycetota bacterium]MBU4007505.1 DUF4406 domain-containing protein [Actinomycetota bacterium]MBU4104092.1 DUF4406 domain-containing protein [Actinomycetota bacterium]MBU4161657.1 DUF4406 domain-containing protein [Actinomycetota bacterium]